MASPVTNSNRVRTAAARGKRREYFSPCGSTYFFRIFRRLKKQAGGDVLLFRSGDHFKAFYDDARGIGDLLGVAVSIAPDGLPSISLLSNRVHENVRALLIRGVENILLVDFTRNESFRYRRGFPLKPRMEETGPCCDFECWLTGEISAHEAPFQKSEGAR